MAVIGAGRHNVSVVSHGLGASSNSTPHVTVLFEDANGDRITWYGYLSDAALERTLQGLGVLGWDPFEHNGMVDSLNGTDLLIGAEAEIVVEMETYEGKVRPKVKWVNPAGGGVAEMEERDASDLAAKLRAKIMSAPRPRANGGPGASRSAAAPAGRGRPLSDPDDDLPF